MATVLNNVKDLARLRGLSLSTVADRAGISRASIYTWDRRQPTATALQAVARVLGVDGDVLTRETVYSGRKLTDGKRPRIAAGQAIAGASSIDLSAVLDDASTTLLYKGRKLDARDIDTVKRVLDR